MTTTGDLDANIDTGVLIETEDEDGLVEFGPEDLSGEELEGRTIDLDKALAGNAPRDGCKSQLSVNSSPSLRVENRNMRTGSVLLLAKNLDCLWCRHVVCVGQDSFLCGRRDLNFLRCQNLCGRGKRDGARQLTCFTAAGKG